MSTRPHCQGTVTANTFTQLQTKDLGDDSEMDGAIDNRLIVQHNREPALSSRAQSNLVLCGPELPGGSSEAFAGQHAVTSTSLYLFDEASAISDKIFEVAERGFTDGEPMIFAFGNPTRSTGKFYRIIRLGTGADSRNCALPNKRRATQSVGIRR
jgi:hypothetical protein